MRSSLTLKALVFCSVCYVTWFATEAVKAQFKSSKSVAANLADAPPQATPGPSKVGTYHPTTPILLQAPFPQRISDFHQSIESKGSLKEESVEVVGNDVTIRASVDMMSRVPDRSHLWRLRVKNTDTGRVVSDKPYLEQMFEIGHSGIINPQFQEVLNLPSGNYISILSMNRLPDGVNFDNLPVDFGSIMFPMISVPKKFRVP